MNHESASACLFALTESMGPTGYGGGGGAFVDWQHLPLSFVRGDDLRFGMS